MALYIFYTSAIFLKENSIDIYSVVYYYIDIHPPGVG